MKLLKYGDTPNFYRDEDSKIFYVKKMINGRVIWRSTGHTTEKSAQRRYREIMGQFDEKKSGWEKNEVPTLSEWWTQYRGAKKKSPRTWKREEKIMDLHYLPQFGRLTLDEITQNQLERTLQWRRKRGAAEGTVTREQSLLHAVFQAAMDDDLIERNPLRKIVRTPYKSRTRVLNREDQLKMQAVLSPMLYRWLVFMLGTGLRLEECRQLRPSRDIDWTTSPVQVHVTGKGQQGEPKERDVPLLDPLLVTVLKEQIAENEGDSKHHRRNRKDSLWGQEQSFFRKELTKACKEAGVKRFSPHVLRHSFATRYLQSGGSIFILSKILGHHSVEITEKVYAHLLTADHAKLSEHVNLGLTGEAP